MTITIYTCGSRYHRRGSGGYGVIVLNGTTETEISGYSPNATTNNMSLTGFDKGVKSISPRSDITIYTNSRLIEKAINKGIANKWKRDGWRRNYSKQMNSNTASLNMALLHGAKIPNSGLWVKLLTHDARHNLTVKYIKRGSGNEYNKRVDKLARIASGAKSP